MLQYTCIETLCVSFTDFCFFVSKLTDTVCSEKTFSISVGAFPWEMSFKHLTIGGQPVSWPEAQKQALHISQVHLKNGSFIYQFRVPFSYPAISQKVRRGEKGNLTCRQVLKWKKTYNKMLLLTFLSDILITINLY